MPDKKLIGRGGMQTAPGKESPLGYWPDNLDHTNNGWTGQAFGIYSQALNIGKVYHDRNFALSIAQQTVKQPELPDVQARNQLAKADAKRLAELKAKMAQIDSEVRAKESELRPFDYESGGMIDAMRRQEMRAHLPMNSVAKP